MEKKSMRVIREYTMITAATFVVAAAVYFFLIPSGVSVGSISGLAMLLGNVIPLPISVLTFILNAALLVVGFLFIGREFGVKTVYTSLILPVFLWVFEQVFPDFVSLNQDAMMDTVCYIFVVSVGLALLFWMNASSGGLDIVAKLLNKYFHMELGKAMALPGMCVRRLFVASNRRTCSAISRRTVINSWKRLISGTGNWNRRGFRCGRLKSAAGRARF